MMATGTRRSIRGGGGSGGITSGRNKRVAVMRAIIITPLVIIMIV